MKLFPFLAVIRPPLLFSHGNHHDLGTLCAKALFESFYPLLIHAVCIIGDTYGLLMTVSFEKGTHLKSAAKVINGDIHDPLRFFAEAVIHNKRDPHMAAQIHIVLAAEADHHQTVHIPHGGKLKDLIRIFGFFHHHKLPVGFNFCGQGIQR